MTTTNPMGADLELISPYPLQDVGTRMVLGNTVYRYVKATAALTAGNVYKLGKDFTVGSALTTANATGPALLCVTALTGVTSAALSAAAAITGTSAVYFWAEVGGALTGIKFAADCAENVKIYTTATGGTVDDSSSSTVLLPGLSLNATITTSAVAAAFSISDLHIIS